MDFQATLMVMAAAAPLFAVSLWQVRRPRRFPPPLMPWHGLLFVSLMLLLFMAAHLPAVWPD